MPAKLGAQTTRGKEHTRHRPQTSLSGVVRPSTCLPSKHFGLFDPIRETNAPAPYVDPIAPDANGGIGVTVTEVVDRAQTSARFEAGDVATRVRRLVICLAAYVRGERST